MWRQWLAVTFGGFFCRRPRLSHLGRCCCCGRRRPNLRCAAAAAAATIAAASAFVAANEMRNHVDRHGKDDGCIFFITNCTEGLEKRDVWIIRKKQKLVLKFSKLNDQNLLLWSRHLVIFDPQVQWRNHGIFLGAER